MQDKYYSRAYQSMEHFGELFVLWILLLYDSLSTSKYNLNISA